MTCNLTSDELHILNILYINRCFSSSSEYNSDLLKKKFNFKTDAGDFDVSIQLLLNEGYITTVSKRPPKYYISDRKKVIFALKSHGFNVITGKVRPL